MTEIKDLEDKVMSVKDIENNNNSKTIESPTNNLTFYYSILTVKVSTLSNHSVESDKLLASLESVQNSNFDLLAPAQLVDFPIKDSVGKNLIEL